MCNIEFLDRLARQTAAKLAEMESLGKSTIFEKRILYFRLSWIEELIAKQIPQTHFDGWIARKGAILAAINAGMPKRAKNLFIQYTSKEKANRVARRELEELFDTQPAG